MACTQQLVQDDIATNNSVVDGRLCLAPVMSKKELRKGFAISAAVPFVKAGTLKARAGPNQLAGSVACVSLFLLGRGFRLWISVPTF